MRPRTPTISEGDIIRYAAEHPEVANGRGFHSAKAHSARWRSERAIPSLLRAFDPAVIAAEIRRHLGGSTEATPKPRPQDTAAAWYIQTLFDIANNKEGPTNARLHALRRIRGLMAACLSALHEPIRTPPGDRAAAEKKGEDKLRYAEYIRKQLSDSGIASASSWSPDHTQ